MSDFQEWWDELIQRLRDCGLEEVPKARPIDHEAFEGGTTAEEWSYVYFDPDADDIQVEIDEDLELLRDVPESDGGLRPDQGEE